MREQAIKLYDQGDCHEASHLYEMPQRRLGITKHSFYR